MERINEGFNMNKFKKKARNVFKKVKANVPSSKNTRSGGKYKWVWPILYPWPPRIVVKILLQDR